MGHIRQLSDDLANKIAAGEVVERPASVIKELTENSIDASAKNITIMVEQGGTQSMCVIDDGIGMNHADAILCFSRHATSKIADENDLFNITTLGFRGEAIPSIASVSSFTLETSDGEESTKIYYEFGKRKSVEEVSMNRGTKITVERIFQNVPARLKYMKSINAEFAAIYTYVERLSLAHPEIAFTLIHDHKTIFKTNGRNHLLEVISDIYGLPVAKNMIHVNFGNEEFHIQGYISKIDTSRSSKNHIITLVNHRYVRNMKTINTINEVYRRYLADKRFPIAVIEIDVDPYLVDVNVHPAKLEVRFSKETELKELLLKGLEESLNKKNLTYKAMSRETEKASFKPSLAQMSIPFEENVREVEDISLNEPIMTVQEEIPVYEPNKKDSAPQSIQEKAPKAIKEKINVIGQTRGTYILGENERGFFMIDQHAAQERINYEYFLDKFSHPDLSMQPLIVPLTFEYPESECMIIEEHKDLLEQVGIHLETFGRHSYIVRGLPLWMKNIDEKIFIDEMIQEILNNQTIDIVAMQEHAIATLACKASVKGNTYLTIKDMQTIVDNLMRCDNPYVCPHGRPTVIVYSDYDLEKLFKRVVV